METKVFKLITAFNGIPQGTLLFKGGLFTPENDPKHDLASEWGQEFFDITREMLNPNEAISYFNIPDNVLVLANEDETGQVISFLSL